LKIESETQEVHCFLRKKKTLLRMEKFYSNNEVQQYAPNTHTQERKCTQAIPPRAP
jgi:hypothetical protein